MQITEPFAIRHIALPAGDILDVAGVHQEDREAAGLEDFIERNPIDAGGFHRDTRHPAGGEPVGEAIEIPGERGERSDRCRIAIGGHGDEVFGLPAINPCRMWVDAVEDGGRDARLGGVTTALAFHRRLLYTSPYASGNRDADEGQSPKRDHAGEGVSPVTMPRIPGPR